MGDKDAPDAPNRPGKSYPDSQDSRRVAGRPRRGNVCRVGWSPHLAGTLCRCAEGVPLMAVPVILDCDPGHDDAFAIWLAAGHPNLDLLGITTVGGNGQLAQTTHNARVICTVAGIKAVPIAAGADSPLIRTLHTAWDIHGASALDGPVLPEPEVELDPRGAVAMLRELLTESAEPVVLI